MHHHCQLHQLHHLYDANDASDEHGRRYRFLSPLGVTKPAIHAAPYLSGVRMQSQHAMHHLPNNVVRTPHDDASAENEPLDDLGSPQSPPLSLLHHRRGPPRVTRHIGFRQQRWWSHLPPSPGNGTTMLPRGKRSKHVHCRESKTVAL